MAVNSSSSNASFPPAFSFTRDSILSFMNCILSGSNFFIFISFYITYVLLLLPNCLFIIHHCLQQRRHPRSTSSAPWMTNSDFFTCHLVVMELIGITGYTLNGWAVNVQNSNLALVGLILCKMTWHGETLFHTLTCADRYLAVVHPITYLTLKTEKGLRIRNITTGCVWTLSFVAMGLAVNRISLIIDPCVLFVSLTIISFCSLSVLHILIRPRPGEQGGAKKRVDKSKLKAFYTIMVILGVLVLRLAWGLVWCIESALGSEDVCLIVMCTLWFNLPSSLVLLLLFLHRAGKLVCWRTASDV